MLHLDSIKRLARTMAVGLSVTLPLFGAVGTAAAGSAPDGYFDSVGSGKATGWTCDRDNYSKPLWIHFYKEGGVYVAGVLADKWRADLVGACGGNGAHGFEWPLPAELQDGRPHTLWAYALDIRADGSFGADGNPSLRNGPKTFVEGSSGPGTPTMVLTEQPTNITATNIDMFVLPELGIGALPKNRLVVRTNTNTTGLVSTSGDLSAQTGYQPGAWHERGSFQRSVNSNANASAVQAHNGELGLWINANSNPHDAPVVPITPATWWELGTAPRPFSAPGKTLSFRFEAKVPTATKTGAAESYIGVSVMFRDTTLGVEFWYTAALFDLRPRVGEYIHFDGPYPGSTNMAILLGELAPGTRWSHMGPGSVAFQTAPFGDYRVFDWRVSESQFQAAVADLKGKAREQCDRDPGGAWCRQLGRYRALSDNPANYIITNVNLNPEVYAPSAADNGKIGMTVKNLKVAVY